MPINNRYVAENLKEIQSLYFEFFYMFFIFLIVSYYSKICNWNSYIFECTITAIYILIFDIIFHSIRHINYNFPSVMIRIISDTWDRFNSEKIQYKEKWKKKPGERNVKHDLCAYIVDASRAHRYRPLVRCSFRKEEQPRGKTGLPRWR